MENKEFDINGMITYDEVLLTAKAVYAECVRDISTLYKHNNKMFFHMLRSDISDSLIMRLQNYVAFHLADEREVIVYFKVYATWWDNFKATYMPKWFTNKYPVKYKELSKSVFIEKGSVYPEMNIPNGQRFPAIFTRTEPIIHDEEVGHNDE